MIQQFNTAEIKLWRKVTEWRAMVGVWHGSAEIEAGDL